MSDCHDCGRPCCGEKRERTGANWKKRWERLREKPVAGIDTLPDGSLVSAKATEEEEEVEELKKKPGFNAYARDGDLDGLVQDGSPHQRRSRTLSHRAIGKRRVGKPTRVRLRDMPYPYAPDEIPATPPARPQNTEQDV